MLDAPSKRYALAAASVSALAVAAVAVANTVECVPWPGGDGAVNAGDIDCFVYAVVNGTVCPEAPADCYRVANDVNGDGSINAADIDAFVDAVVNGACE